MQNKSWLYPAAVLAVVFSLWTAMVGGSSGAWATTVVAPSASSTTTTAGGALATYENPVVGFDSPDPDVLRVGSQYYAFTTASDYVNIPEYTSSDLSHWHHEPGDALPHVPAWSTPGRTWAPGVVQLGGRWLMYYATEQTSTGLQCLSVASATTPGGPYADTSKAPIVCQANLGGSIDPDPLVDSGGRAWLIWKSNGAGPTPAQLWGSALTNSGSLSGQPTLLLAANRSGDGGVIENPFMVQAGGSDVLLFSQNQWESASYAVSYAVCRSMLGPCTRPDAPPVLESSSAVLGPGGESVFTDAGGSQWLAYHAWSAPDTSYADGGSRTLRIDPLTFSGTTPVVAGPSVTPSFVATPHRIAGDDRYSTAAKFSAAKFPGGAATVYVSTGLAYPDALAAGPAAARAKAPILLVSPAGIPTATASELSRLHPSSIVVLGGAGAVPDSVVGALAAYAPVTRVAGPDRFATAAAVSRVTFAPGVPMAYVATGDSYADALAGSAAAGVQGAPVLLTGGRSLPSSTLAELQRLQPAGIVVLGGAGAVSDGVVSQLTRVAPVVRLAGPDRYGTAAAIAGFAFRTAVPEVLVATGVSYPDALAASAAAEPILLAPPSGAAPAEASELRELNPTRVVSVGGTAALPESALIALLGP